MVNHDGSVTHGAQTGIGFVTSEKLCSTPSSKAETSIEQECRRDIDITQTLDDSI